jgi:hypothetical protein
MKQPTKNNNKSPNKYKTEQKMKQNIQKITRNDKSSASSQTGVSSKKLH